MNARTETYHQLLLDPAWRKRRKDIIKRDMGLCRNCASDKDLEVHHRQYHIDTKTGAKKLPWDYADKYLVTLCSTCHQKGHEIYKIPVFKY